MADNTAVPGTGVTFADDDIAGIKYPRNKIVWGVDGSQVDTSAAAPFPTADAAVLAAMAAATIPVGAGTAAAAGRMTLASDDPGVVALQLIDNAVSGAGFNITQVGGVNVSKGGGASDTGTLRTMASTDDPAVATLGATSGAKVVTDATGTIQQYLRGLVSFFANAINAGTAATAIRVVQATDDTINGTVTETAPTTDTASSGLNGRLQRIAQRLTSLISPGLSGSATFTPAAASHVANDCNGAAGTFALGAISAGRIMITGVTLEIDGATAEATTWRLMLYDVTPPSAIADDGAWTYADADRAAFKGLIEVGTAIDHGPNQWIEQSGINKPIKMAGTSLYGYLVNLATLTPQAVAHIVTIHAVQL